MNYETDLEDILEDDFHEKSSHLEDFNETGLERYVGYDNPKYFADLEPLGMNETMKDEFEIQKEYLEKAEQFEKNTQLNKAIRDIQEAPEQPENTDIRRDFRWDL